MAESMTVAMNDRIRVEAAHDAAAGDVVIAVLEQLAPSEARLAEGHRTFFAIGEELRDQMVTLLKEARS